MIVVASETCRRSPDAIEKRPVTILGGLQLADQGELLDLVPINADALFDLPLSPP